MIRIWLGWLARGVVALIVAAALLYLGDAGVQQYRASHGTGYGTVEVHQFLATQLKGSKVEYDSLGTVQRRCSRSIFPQNGSPACWWLARNPTEWQ